MLNALRCPLLPVLLVALTFQGLSVGYAALPETDTANGLLSRDAAEFPDDLRHFLRGIPSMKTPPSVEDLWRLAEKEKRERKEGTLDYLTYRQSMLLIETIARLGGRNDLQRLVKSWEEIPPTYLRGQSFIPISDLWIKLELETIARENLALNVHLGNKPTVLPAVLQKADPELQEAWKTFHAAVDGRGTPPATLERFKQPWIRVQESWPSFYGVIMDFLLGTSTNAAARLAMFEWGGWCGTGRDTLDEPKNRALFMAFLRERRHPDAVAQILSALGTPSSILSRKKASQGMREYIQMCGLNWETLFAGAVVEAAYGNRTALHDMAAFGSDLSARYLVQMGTLTNLTRQSDYIVALGAMITPAGQTKRQAPGDFALPAISQPSISPGLQSELLQILCNMVHPQASLETTRAVAAELSRLLHPEGKEALRRIAAMPYDRPSAEASAALKRMGETPVSSKRTGQMAVQLLVDMQPLADTLVEFEARGTNGGFSTSQQTDSTGVMRLERDYLADPTRPVIGIFLSTRKMQRPEDLWISTKAPPPQNFDAPLVVHAKTQRLGVRIRTPQAPAPPPQMTVVLKAECEKSYGTYFDNVSESMTLPLNSTLLFPALQPGRYRVEILVPGTARWVSEDITLGTQPVEAEAVLQRGSDVRFALAAPGKEKHDSGVRFEVYKDGKRIPDYLHYDYQTQTLRGLPFGRYTLKVPGSSEELAARRSPNEQVTEPFAYFGTEVNFTVDENSPAVLDLGTVHLR